MKCKRPECGNEVPVHSLNCVVCGLDAGAPNVRFSKRNEEHDALNKRVLAAKALAAAAGCEEVLNEFQAVVANKSEAVICRSLGKFKEIVSSDNQLFNTYYQAVTGEERVPEDNSWDKSRQSVDALFFPNYAEHIRFASLSLDGKGIRGYGSACATLKSALIMDRSSVFEMNTIEFVKKNSIIAGGTLPDGYRAPWDRRDMLAIAKLADRLTPQTADVDFPSILAGSDERDSDFIEVHIYGPIHRRTIERFSCPTPRTREDKVILKSIVSTLKQIGVEVETF